MPAQHCIVLPSILDISAASALLSTCKDMQDEAEPLLLDATAVERITTPAFQVIISLIKTRKAAGRLTQLQSASTPFTDAAGALGLSGFFKEEAAHG